MKRAIDIDLSFAVSSNRWALQASAPCQRHCAFANSSDPENATSIAGLEIHMSSSTAGVLPELVEYDVDGSRPWKGRLMRTEHKIEGTAQPLNAEPVSVMPDVGAPSCNLAPCEPSTWPTNQSLQVGLQALMESSEWATWRVQHPSWFPTHYSLAHNRVTTSILDVPVLAEQSLAWRFEFGYGPPEVATFNVDSAWNGFAWSEPTVSGPVVERSGMPSWALQKSNTTSLVMLDGLWAQAKMDLPFPVDELQATIVVFSPPVLVPDERLSVSIYFVASVGYCRLNAHLGEPIECRRTQN